MPVKVTSRKGSARAVVDVKECQRSSGEGDEQVLEAAIPTASRESVTSRNGPCRAVVEVKECQPSSGEEDEQDLEVTMPTGSRKGPSRAVVEVKEYQTSSGENDDYLWALEQVGKTIMGGNTDLEAKMPDSGL